MTEDDDHLSQARAQLDAAQKQLQLLTDAITHDLRAPLRSIEGFAAHLAHSAAPRLDDAERDHLQRIRDAAARMTSLLEGLSELSRATRAELHPAEVDLSLLAEWAAAELREAWPERTWDITVQPGLVTHGDERLLKLMLTQLLDNARRFSITDAPVHVEVTGQRNGVAQWLRVADHGIGFDSHYAHKLFQPLQRLHGPEQGAGNGLGLAIAQRVAQRHGGDISADSRPGDGAVFTVTLPTFPSDGNPG
ncbi:sensor histidine kinase [Lysobacter fragariae]